MEGLLVVVPEGWVEIPQAADVINGYPGELDAVRMMIREQRWADLLTVFNYSEIYFPPEGATIADAMVLSDAEMRFWVKFV